MKKLYYLTMLVTAFGLVGQQSSLAVAQVTTEIVLCLDISGSINPTELQLEVDGLKACLNNTLIVPHDGTVAVGIVTFSGVAVMQLGLTSVTPANLTGIIFPVLDGLTTGGSTNIPAGLDASRSILLAGMLAGGTSDDQFILLTSDGFSSGDVPAACQAVNDDSITICAIAIGVGADTMTLQNCALATGGAFAFAPTFDDFLPVCEKCLVEILEPLECEVAITSPSDGTVISGNTVAVEGVTSITGGIPPFTITCEVNGITATVTDTMFMATVPCSVGVNTIVATCNVIDGTGAQFTCRDTIQVECQLPLILGVDGDNSILYLIDRTGTPTLVNLGTIVNGSGKPIVDLEAMTWDPFLERLFVISNEDDGPLYMIDPSDIPVVPSADIPTTLIGNTESDDIEDIAIHPVTGEMFGVDNTSHKLVKICKTDGHTTEIGDLGFKDVEGIAFNSDPEPVLFGADTRTEKLITINIGSGAGTPVHPTNLIGFPQVECLVFAPDTLFGYSNSTIDEFITINRTTGMGILFPVAGTSELIDIEGLAFIMADTSLFGNTAALTTDTEADNETSAPENYTLKQNYPNPFNPTTKIRFDIPDKFVGGEHVQLRIYNLLGELVRVLVDEQKFPGQYVVEWDGRDKHGKFVSSGIHIYQLVAGDLKETKRMILLK